MTTSLENVFYNDTTIKTQVGATIEYNMNSLIDNITVTSTITDTNYTSTIDNWVNGKPNPFKKLFPIDSVIKPFRPINPGINYYILGPNQSKGTPLSFDNPKTNLYPDTKPRVYYPGITTSYKYWVTPVNSNLNLTVNYVNSNNTKLALANKIVIKFEKFHNLPSSYIVVITKSDDTTMTFTSATSPTTGDATIYYNGTSWSSTAWAEPASYPTPISIKSITVTGVNPGGDKVIGVIEVSARWIKDISSDIFTLDIQKESSSSTTDILPVGSVTANTLTLALSKYNQSELQIISYNRLSTSFDSSKIYIAKNVEIKPYFKVYHINGAIINGSDKYDKVYQGSYFVDSWAISDYGDTNITALDGSKYLMETLCPDLILESYPVTAILRCLLDSIGFTNYNFNLTESDKSIPLINYWWTVPENTVWQAIQDLCRDIQMNAFFDESNILQFYSRESMYNRTNANWNFYYEKEGSILPNIIDFSKEEIASANQVKILWSTPITSNYTGASGKLWNSPPTFLAAGGLKYDITAETTAAQTVLILELASLDNYSDIQSLFNFNGYLLIDSEIIEYDAIRYQYIPKDSTTNIAEAVWIESESDINKYLYLSKPGYKIPGKFDTAYFKPTGEYRVKTRGALGTKPAFHGASSINKLAQWSGREVVWT